MNTINTANEIALPAGCFLRDMELGLLHIMPGMAKAANREHYLNLDVDFDERAVRTPIVGYMGGKPYIIKGETTIAVLRQHHYESWVCYIVPVANEQDAFGLRFKIEGCGNRKAGDIDMFRYGLHKGLVPHAEIWDVVVNVNGFHIPLTVSEARRGLRDNSITAVKALERIHREHGGRQGLARTMNVLCRCFLANPRTRRLQTAARKHTFLESMACFIRATSVPLRDISTQLRAAGFSAADIVEEAERRSRTMYPRYAGKYAASQIPGVLDDLVTGVLQRD